MERKQQPGGLLEMFVVYDHPLDYPGHFVVRRWSGDQPTENFAVARTIEEARAHVPMGLHRLPRQPDDDAAIVEVWL